MSLYSFFAQQEYEENLKHKDKLSKVRDMVVWEKFRPVIEGLYKNNTVLGGRPNHDVVVMLKIMVLQYIFDLSDEALEAALHDRISFRNFIGFDTPIPDARSIWVFRERLAENKLYEEVWNELINFLEADDFFDGSAMIQDSTTIHTCQGKKRRSLEKLAEKNGQQITYTEKQQAHIVNGGL
jgi:IS5 family transposase